MDGWMDACMKFMLMQGSHLPRHISFNCARLNVTLLLATGGCTSRGDDDINSTFCGSSSPRSHRSCWRWLSGDARAAAAAAVAIGGRRFEGCDTLGCMEELPPDLPACSPSSWLVSLSLYTSLLLMLLLLSLLLLLPALLNPLLPPPFFRLILGLLIPSAASMSAFNILFSITYWYLSPRLECLESMGDVKITR
jgi:hypothetical protein